MEVSDKFGAWSGTYGVCSNAAASQLMSSQEDAAGRWASVPAGGFSDLHQFCRCADALLNGWIWRLAAFEYRPRWYRESVYGVWIIRVPMCLLRSPDTGVDAIVSRPVPSPRPSFPVTSMNCCMLLSVVLVRASGLFFCFNFATAVEQSIVADIVTADCHFSISSGAPPHLTRLTLHERPWRVWTTLHRN